MDGDLNEQILRRGFGVFHEDIEVAVLVKYARVKQLIFRSTSAAVSVSFDQIVIWKGCLRVFVEGTSYTSGSA